MNKKCNIARDLMPLVIDKAASEDSGEFVLDHIAACAECRAQYEEMKKGIDSPAVNQADSAFAQSVKALKQKQRILKLLVAALCLFLACCLAFTGLEIYNGLKIHNLIPKPASEISARIFTFPSGVLEIAIESEDGNMYSGMASNLIYINDSNEATLYIWAQKPRYASLTSEVDLVSTSLYSASNLQFFDEKLYMIDRYYNVKTVSNPTRKQAAAGQQLEYVVIWDAPKPVSEIRYGDPSKPDESILLYSAGDAVDEISAGNYISLLKKAGKADPSLPHDFYENSTYVFSLAQAWARGEELPAIPRRYLPSVQDYPDMEAAQESASLYIYLPRGSTLSEPFPIAEQEYTYSMPVDPPDADKAEIMESDAPAPLPTETKTPE